MKSVRAEAATISKAVEEAWKKAGNPIEFFTKIVEEPKAGFLGFGAKSAVIALFFKKESIKSESDKLAKPEIVRQESYVGFFNNKNLTVEAPSQKQPQHKQPQKKDAATSSQQQQSQNQRRKESHPASSNVNPNQNRNNQNQNRNQGQQKNQNQGQNKPHQTAAAAAPVQNNSEKREARPQRPHHQPVHRNPNPNNNQNRNNQNKNTQNNKHQDNSGLPSKEDKLI